MIATTQPTEAKLLVDGETAAELLSVSRRTLARLTAPHGALPCLRIGTGKRRLLRYRVADLTDWIERSLQPADAAGAD